MTVFMGEISELGEAKEIRKGIRNCRKMETLKKFEHGLNKAVQQGTVLETDRYKYLELDTNRGENLKDHK